MRRPLRLLAATAAAVSLCLGPAAVEAVAAPASPPPTTPSASDTYEASVVKQANKQRAKKHKHKLKASSCVDRFAEQQAEAMAASHSMYHQPMGPILQECHLSLVGENVAYGFADGKSVTKAWMHSKGHRENLLRSRYRLIGVGAVQDDTGVWYVSQVFGRKA